MQLYKKLEKCANRLTELDEKIVEHDRADINYQNFGLRILELAKNAKNLMKIATPQEQHELLKFLLSNSTLRDGKPDSSLKKPFL